MPYEYRKLTPKEKEEILEIRKARGYPQHRPPHPINESGFYHITAACFNHAEIINSPKRRTEFEIRLLKALESINAETTAWVVLPNHYHFLANLTSFEAIPNMIKKLHNGSSYEWNREDGCVGTRKVWFHYSDRYMRTEKQMYQVFNYIHINPVKHAYVESPYDWSWSSLPLYYQDNGREWLRDLWKAYPANNLSLE